MPTQWVDQKTHAVATYGEHSPFGEGSFGGTAWEILTAPATQWQDNHLHQVAEYGGENPPGEGSFAGTVWEIAL